MALPRTLNVSHGHRCYKAISWLSVVSSCLVLSACGMVGLKPIEVESGVGCYSTLGSYFLAKSNLTLLVTEKSETLVEVESNVVRLPDTRASYCLDFLGSPTSDDKVVVKRSKEGLLDVITGNAEDKTPEIVDDLVNTIQQAAVGIGASRNLRSVTTEQQSYQDSFDPFDHEEMKIVNDRLYDFGLCLLLRKGADVDLISKMASDCTKLRNSVRYNRRCASKSVIAQNAAYCAGQRPTERDQALFGGGPPVLASEPLPTPEYRGGILYRPRLPYGVYVLRKTNRRLSGGWAVLQKKVVYLENQAPVLAVGVDRTIFADRFTTLKFDNGMLTEATIDKKSELVGFVSIPLKVANAILDIPAQIVQLRINRTNARTNLIAAETALIEARAALEIARQNYESAANPQAPAVGLAADGMAPDLVQ